MPEPSTKPWYASKTIWAMAIAALIGAGNLALDQQISEGQIASAIIAGVGALGVILRVITGKPIE